MLKFNKFTNLLKSTNQLIKRNYLSEAYYLNKQWEDRLKSPILQKINIDDLYYDIDKKYQQQKIISAIDVDLFANILTDNTFLLELKDLLHKLRKTPECKNLFSSTNHAAIRLFLKCNEINDLNDVLDDRLNYGIFLDAYDANILLNICLKRKEYANAARVASQLMLQEDFSVKLTKYLSALSCYEYLKDPKGWPEPPLPEPEPKEEIKIRVKYLRNPYFDDHFDLRNHYHIVGKTLAMIGKTENDTLHNSLRLLGLTVYDKLDKAEEFLKNLESNKSSVYKEIVSFTEEKKLDLKNLKIEESNLFNELENRIRKEEKLIAEKDINEQVNLYNQWETDRVNALNEQKARFLRVERLKAIEESQKELAEKEKLLWFFENEEQIELQIESKKSIESKQKNDKIKSKKDDEDYIPPQI